MLTSFLLSLALLVGYEVLPDRSHNFAEVILGDHYADLGEAIQAAADQGWTTVRLPRGTHAIGTPFAIEADYFSLEGHGDTIVTNATTGLVGYGTLTGQQATVSNLNFDITTWVDDQVGLTISDSREPVVSNTTWEYTINGVDNDSADFMTGLLMEGNWGEEVYSNTAHPRKGMVPFRTHLAANANWHHNSVTTDVLREPTSGGDYREVHIPYYMEGMFKSTFSHNFAGGLGSVTNKIPHVLLMQWDTVFTGEQGHNNIESNQFEDCYAQRWISMYGGKFSRIQGNLLGQNEAAASVFQALNYAVSAGNNHAAINISSADHGGTGGTEDITIQDNDIHNWGSTDNVSPCISMTRAARVYIKGNRFGLVNKSDGTIAVDGDLTTNDLYITNNHFDGAGQLRPLFIFQGTDASQINRVVFKDNTIEGFTGNEPTFGVYGPYDPFGFGFDSTLTIASKAISFTNIATAGVPSMIAVALGPFTNGLAVTATTLTRSDGGSFIDDGFKVGDVFTVAAAEQAGNNGNHTATTVTATVLTASGSTFNTTGTPDTTMTLKPNVFQSLVVGDYIQVKGAASNKQNGIQKISTKTAVQIGLTTEFFETGGGPLPTNDFAIVGASPIITVEVFRRGFNSNKTN